MVNSTKKSRSILLIVLCWFFYSVSYLCKVNYAANITGIIDFYGVTKAQAGLPSTLFFFAYGVGQVFNGILCKKYNIKWVVFSSIIISSAINLVVALTTNFTVVTWLWMINGFSLSLLWPTIIRLLSESLPQSEIVRSGAIMGTSIPIGTLLVYGLSSVFAAFDNFKLAFYSAAVAAILIAVAWMIAYKKAVKIAVEEKECELCETEYRAINLERKQQTSYEKKIFYVTVCILCLCAIGSNMTKDGITTWLPKMLQEEYAVSDSLSILLTVLLPIVALFSNFLAIAVHKKISDYVTESALLFGVIFILVGFVLGSLTLKSIVGMLGGLIAVTFVASSINNLMTVLFPMFMRDKVDSGLFAGILNGFCYVGSTISSYGFGAIADNFGWTSVFYTLLGTCVFVFALWIMYSVIKRVGKNRAES